MNTTPEQILDIEDALVSDENPARDKDTLDYQRCARLHNYLVAYAYMARNGTNTPDLDALASESWFSNQPNENIEAIRARLDPSLNSFLDSIYDPTPGFFYWVSRLRMELADESFPLEDNDFEDKERFVVIYDTTPDLGSHCLGILYDQLNHRASFPLTIVNSESIEPVAEHWDMWFPLETILTQWIHMLRMGKITADPRKKRDLSDEEANSRHQIGLWCWHPYCAAQIDSTVAAMDRYTDAIESRMQSLLQISRDAPFFTDAELDAALVPKECFSRSFLTRVRTPRFKLIAPGLEVPHDKEAFTARQMFNAEGRGRDVPSVLLFGSADDSRKIRFNEEIHRLFFGSRNDVPFNEGDPVPTRLYSATVNRFEYDSEETGFHLLQPFALRPNLADEDGARRSDGTLVPSGSFTQLFQHGVFHPFGGEHRAQRLERLFDRWTELIESGVWTVGENGVEGGIDMFQDADHGAWEDYWISPILVRFEEKRMKRDKQHQWISSINASPTYKHHYNSSNLSNPEAGASESKFVVNNPSIMSEQDLRTAIETLKGQIDTFWTVNHDRKTFWPYLLNQELYKREKVSPWGGCELMGDLLNGNLDVWNETPGALDFVKAKMAQAERDDFAMPRIYPAGYQFTEVLAKLKRKVPTEQEVHEPQKVPRLV